MAVVDDSRKLTSLQNERVKRAVRIRTGRSRKDPPLLFVEGFRQVRRAMENGVNPTELYHCPALYQGENEPALVAKAGAAGAELYECTEAVLRKLAERDRPDGIIALVPEVRRELASLDLPANPLILVCERIERPGNLGAILRSTDGAGVHAVLVCDRCAAVNDPRVVRASVGTLFAIPVVETGSAQALAWLMERRISILAATPDARTDYTKADMTGPIAIVVGTEQHGLSSKWLEKAAVRVRIPMRGQADSLNVAAAATILAFEAARQRS